MASTLVTAADTGDLETVRRCLETGDDVNGGDDGTALWWAAARGQMAVANLLIEWGANLSATRGGDTPLAIAARCNKPEMAAMLREAVQQPPGPPQPEKWVYLGEDSVAFTGYYAPIKKKLTQLFNFASRERLTIVENLRSNTDTMVPATSFDDLPRPVLEKALEEFERGGGKADRDYVLQGQGSLGKQRKPLLGEPGHG